MIEMSRGLAIHYQTAGDEQRCHRNTSVTDENVSKMERTLNSARMSNDRIRDVKDILAEKRIKLICEMYAENVLQKGEHSKSRYLFNILNSCDIWKKAI